MLVLLAAGTRSKALIKTAPDRLATASSLEPGQLRPLGAVSPELAAQRNPAGQRSAPTPPAARGSGDPRAQPRSMNRLFPAQELGLIEPPDRDQWQPPDQIMDDLNIAEGAVVADIGAGGGWFTIQLARRVAQLGIVYAEDVQQEMLRAVQRRAQRENLANVRTVLGSASDPQLPSGLDAAIIVDGYHEMACAAKPSCDEPVALLRSVARSLKPQGRLGIVDFFPGEGGPGPSPDQRVDPDTVIRAAANAGLQLLKRRAIPPFQFQYLLVFGRVPGGRIPS
jgi:SAM-dependent methyltransferase